MAADLLKKAYEVLGKYYGYSSFREGQEELISELLAGRDVLGVMPTGAGKSLCYQIPALVQEGTALVISPLISLMKDQVDALSEMGISVAFINSTLSAGDFGAIMRAARRGGYKLLYIAPERLATEGFRALLQKIPLSLVAVDEAHCISQWGHDFRPSYLEIAAVIGELPERPNVAAFTATATARVKEDIAARLELRQPYVLTTGFDRQNLYFGVEKPSKKMAFVLNYLKRHAGESGIIYCSTRKNVEKVYESLLRKGYAAARYHAGLPETERAQSQSDFLYDRKTVMVATNAFGMGIDKSNVRFVLHYNMPKDMESYYQEAGRAGRDGAPGECNLLYSGSDIVMAKYLIEQGGDEELKAGELRRLQQMVNYCHTVSCLRRYFLKYFGETEREKDCGNCSSCLSTVASMDITIEAQKILSCVYRMKERFGVGLVAEVLLGRDTQRIRNLRFNQLSTYGLMKEYQEKEIKDLISHLTAENCLVSEGEKYPILRILPKGYAVLRGQAQIEMKKAVRFAKEAPSKAVSSADPALFEVLCEVRKTLAERQKVPPFVIFSDATLKEMAARCPNSPADLLKVSGVGQYKVQKYGEAFLNAIWEYAQEAER